MDLSCQAMIGVERRPLDQVRTIPVRVAWDRRPKREPLGTIRELLAGLTAGPDALVCDAAWQREGPQ